MKRARNTLAARKSRQRKMQRFEELEDKSAKLEAERDHWKNISLKRTSGQPKPLAKFLRLARLSRETTLLENMLNERSYLPSLVREDLGL
jgi:hypothetical protein